MNDLRRYMTRSRDGTKLLGPYSRVRTYGIAGLRIIQGHGRFQIKKNGEYVRENISRIPTMQAFKNHLWNSKVGDTLSVLDNEDRLIIFVREVKHAASVIDTNGNRFADEAWTAVRSEFSEMPVYFLGAYVCKNVSGTSTVSQHSFGNAIDFGSDSMDQLWLIYRFFVRNADRFHVQKVIVDQEQWNRGIGVGFYTGERHHHVHLQFVPNRSGRCGVQEP